ncbi:MAG: hypothetical protein ACR2J8_10325 [Thermomicrobiales bacterium]
MTASASGAAAPRAGDAAPDQTLLDDSGQTVRLSDFWSAAPRALALVFVRHFG